MPSSRSSRCRLVCLSRVSRSTARATPRRLPRASSHWRHRAWLDSKLVIGRYSRPAMARVWSDESKLETWLEVELAALDAWAELGVVPEEVAREVRERATVPSPEDVRRRERETGHD